MIPKDWMSFLAVSRIWRFQSFLSGCFLTSFVPSRCWALRAHQHHGVPGGFGAWCDREKGFHVVVASLLWRSPASLAFAIGCGAFVISESFSNPVALWVYPNGDGYLILPSPPVFPSFILLPLPWHSYVFLGNHPQPETISQAPMCLELLQSSWREPKMELRPPPVGVQIAYGRWDSYAPPWLSGWWLHS